MQWKARGLSHILVCSGPVFTRLIDAGRQGWVRIQTNSEKINLPLNIYDNLHEILASHIDHLLILGKKGQTTLQS